MRILAIDVGTGTQDILLFDSSKTIENCIKMVMPAPTVIAARRIQEATRAQQPLALTGMNMGGGPVTEAVQSYIRAGLPVYATEEAASTFDDDMEVVEAMGVSLVGRDEIRTLKAARIVELRDVDLGMMGQALAAFEVAPEWDAVAVAVFDHGKAPPRYSDRKFRFDHLRRQVTEGKREVKSFCYLRHEVPAYMTRMMAVTQSVGEDVPLLVMDSAEATVLGALEGGYVASQPCKVVVNVGNEHTLAFHLHDTTIHGIFEHHTHVLTRTKLESYLQRLALGNLDNEEVWLDQGHGAQPIYRSGGLA